MTNSIFKTKEQYFSFRDAWASAVNDKDIRSTLQAEHHILYNILRGKSFDCGFTPITNSNKLQNGAYINHGLYNAMRKINRLQNIAKKITYGEKITEYNANAFAEFIAPFGNTVTVDMFATIKLPEVKPIYSDYGSSKQVATQIVRGEFKPTSFEQVYAAIAAVVEVA